MPFFLFRVVSVGAYTNCTGKTQTLYKQTVSTKHLGWDLARHQSQRPCGAKYILGSQSFEAHKIFL